ncbi:MAG: glycogen/starch synthase [Thermodesulfovibrionales bacterium]|jgi:starch synthase|nr:glycogen/starch synthase [Thermodesulfovibrionales bacterium]
MKVAIVTSEAVPFSKTGGLADVTGTLFKEYLHMGIEAFLFMPLYKRTAEQFGEEIQDTGIAIDIPIGKASRQCKVFTLKSQGKGRQNTDKKNLASDFWLLTSERVFFIGNEEYFGRDELYGTPRGDYPDNDQRFAFFCKSVLELCKKLKIDMDVIHCNDWQTGLIPIYLKTLYSSADVFRKTISVITIHNLGYQGIFPPQTMEITGLGWEFFQMEGVEFYGNVNFLKAGIVGADIITTVSRTYAKEILTPESGFGLDGILRKRADRIYGILNGIDYNEWNPSADKFLPYSYNRSRLSGKTKCKAELMKLCSLEGDTDAPLMSFVGRLSSQKGIDIFADAIPEIITKGANIVILGKGEEYYHTLLNSVRERFYRRLFFYSGFDEAIAHLTYAGSDIFLMPSRYEPCGLGQMIAMRYGTIPIGRNTGGLADTIEDGETGFLFNDYSSRGLMSGIGRALACYADRELWQRMTKSAMGKDFSWERSARLYLELYRKFSR